MLETMQLRNHNKTHSKKSAKITTDANGAKQLIVKTLTMLKLICIAQERNLSYSILNFAIMQLLH